MYAHGLATIAVCEAYGLTSDPLLKAPAIREIAEIADEIDALLVVDNTFLTPVLMRPVDLGADIVGPDALASDSEWSYLISFLPGLKSAGGTEQILRNTIGERVLGLPPEPRLDKGIPFSELRAKEREEAAAR